MTYIILGDNVQNQEIKARMKYLYDIFTIYTFKDTVKSAENVTIIKTFPENVIDLCIIIGHDLTVDWYIQENYKEIKEKNIVIISCNVASFSSLKLLEGKNVYVSKNEGIANLYDGSMWKFGFDVTDEEIMFYRNRNSKKELDVMLNNTFRKIM